MMVSDETRLVVILKGVLVAPAGTETMGGGCAAILFDQTVTVAPPAGAGAFNVIVPVTTVPAGTVVDASTKDWTDELPVNGL